MRKPRANAGACARVGARAGRQRRFTRIFRIGQGRQTRALLVESPTRIELMRPSQSAARAEVLDIPTERNERPPAMAPAVAPMPARSWQDRWRLPLMLI